MIKYGISELAVISVRKEADEKSEMLTHILFGETFQILEEGPKWCYIKITYDEYEGWVNTNTITELSEQLFNQINTSTSLVTSYFSNIIINEKKEKIVIPFGSTLPNYDSKNNSFKINGTYFLETIQSINEKPNIIELSQVLLNAPYLWGGKNPFGIDCSGLVQILFKIMGKKLPRDAKQQIKVGHTINFNSDTIPGDLAFFDDNEGNIIHVGIILNKNNIIHASGKVRIDKLDQQGIFNEETSTYTHKLRIIKRIL